MHRPDGFAADAWKVQQVPSHALSAIGIKLTIRANFFSCTKTPLCAKQVDVDKLNNSNKRRSHEDQR